MFGRENIACAGRISEYVKTDEKNFVSFLDITFDVRDVLRRIRFGDALIASPLPCWHRNDMSE